MMGRHKTMKKKINPIYIDEETEKYINHLKNKNKWNLSYLIRYSIKHLYNYNKNNIMEDGEINK